MSLFNPSRLQRDGGYQIIPAVSGLGLDGAQPNYTKAVELGLTAAASIGATDNVAF